MESDGEHSQQATREAPLRCDHAPLPEANEEESTAAQTQCAGGEVVGGRGCVDGTGQCGEGEEGDSGGREGEKSELSPLPGAPMDSDLAHISSILSKLPAPDAATGDGSTAPLETDIDE